MKNGLFLMDLSGAGTVSFPEGKPPAGTCEYATVKCLKYCAAQEPNEYPRKAGCHVSKAVKRRSYSIFSDYKATELCHIILGDLAYLRHNILYWFGSGDCRNADRAKITEIIKLIPSSIHQIGFTRNRELWRQFPRIFTLTVEDIKDIPTDNQRGRFAIPDYRSGIVQIINSESIPVAQCGYTEGCGIRFGYQSCKYDCSICFSNEDGCFTDKVR